MPTPGSKASEGAPADHSSWIECALDRTTRLCAIGGGLILSGIVLLVVVSILGRTIFNTPIPGDVEIIGLMIGVGAMAFFPYCQWTGGNIRVGLLVESLRGWSRRILEIANQAAFTVMAGFLSLQLVLGTADAFRDGDQTMMTRIPTAWAYLGIALFSVFLTVTCLCQLLLMLGRRRRESA